MQFDARAAKLLKPDEVLKIEGCPGLRLEASASRRAFIYRYKRPGSDQMGQIKIGEWPAMTPVAAATEWERLRALRDAGVDPGAEKRAKRAAEAAPPAADPVYDVAALCEDYLTGHVENARKERGAKEMRRMITSHIGPIANKLPQKVTRADAFNLLDGLASKPVTAVSLRGELGSAWDYALDAGRIPEDTPNWWRSVMRGRLRSKGKKIAGKNIGAGKRALSEPEIGPLINWLPNFSALVEDALTLYLWTATRGSEIVSMEGREVTEEPDGLWWTLPKAKTKNARHELATDLRVPLIGRAEAVVRRRIARYGAGWLFPMQGKRERHSQQETIGSQVYNHMPYSKAAEQRGTQPPPVIRWSPHDLRRTSRTLLAALGCPDPIAEAILGHVQEGIKGVYNRHGYDRERRVWLTKLSVRLEELALQARS